MFLYAYGLFAITLGPIFDQSLEQKVASVLPTAKEDRWLQIPWHANLMAARLEAQSSRKPLFFWVMNGNPLGST